MEIQSRCGGTIMGVIYCDIKGIAPAILGIKTGGIIDPKMRINSSENCGIEEERYIFRKIKKNTPTNNPVEVKKYFVIFGLSG